jgi:hypothetical protein
VQTSAVGTDEIEPELLVALAIASEGNPIALRRYLREAKALAEQSFAAAPSNPRIVAYLSEAYSTLGQRADALKFANLAATLGFSGDLSPLIDIRAREALRDRRYAEAADLWATTMVRGPYEERAIAVIHAVFAALADPRLESMAVTAGQRLFPDQTEAEAHIVRAPCLQAAYSFALISAADLAHGLAIRCLEQTQDTSDTPRIFASIWIPEMRAFRESNRFQTFLDRLGMMDYYRRFGPPDDCDLKDGKLTCH